MKLSQAEWTGGQGRPEGHSCLVSLIPLHTAHWPVKARTEGGIKQGGRGG